MVPRYIGVDMNGLVFVFFFGYICIIAKEQYYDFIETNRVLITAITLLLTIAFIWISQQHESGTHILMEDG